MWTIRSWQRGWPWPFFAAAMRLESDLRDLSLGLLRASVQRRREAGRRFRS